MIHKLTVPIPDEAISALHVGDQVEISGVIFTARDHSQGELIEATNYLNMHYAGLSIEEVRERLKHEIEAPRESAESIVDRAIASHDDHAIKFTEACLREHAIAPSPAYLAAASHAIGALSRQIS